MDRLKELLALDQDQEMDNAQDNSPGAPAARSTAGGRPMGTPSAPMEVEVFAFSIEDALKKAAEAMKVSIVNLEYKILERGESGFLGIGKKPDRILVKVSGSSAYVPRTVISGGGDDLDIGPSEPVIINQDGRYKLIVRQTGVMLRIEPPKGSGRKAELNEVLTHISQREIMRFDQAAVQAAVNRPSGEWVKIGDYNPSIYDSKIQIQVSPDEMKAFVTMTKPEKSGRVPEIPEIVAALKSKNVYYGIKEKYITDAIENDMFNMAICVAEGDPSIEGKDAEVRYHFKTDINKVGMEDDTGNIDFHKLDIVQSVVVGQILATKVPAQRGKAGKTVTGRIIPAKDGRDIKMVSGSNCHLSPDGMQIASDINGQVVFKNGKVNVEPILEVTGDVDPTTGDINFPGNVVIYGNVNDTYKVYSGANIEVKGHIGKADVVAEGNIVVRQGIQGKDEAKIVCGGDLYARFIERSIIRVEGFIYTNEAIMHSRVDCKNKVFCHGGKKSQIVGGQIRALYEVNAKNLGAEAYTETIVIVGTDPEKEERLVEIHRRKDELVKEMPDINKQLSNLSMLMSTGPLPPEKQEIFNNLSDKSRELKEEINHLEEELTTIQEYLETLGKDAKVSASNMVFPGVKVRIKNATLNVKNEFKHITFSREGSGSVKPSPYEKSKELEEKSKDKTKDVMNIKPAKK